MLEKRFFTLFFIFNITLVFSQVNIKSFLPNGYVKDASVDYTEYLQDVLDNYDNIVFPDFPILINDTGLILRSSTKLDFEDGGRLVLKPSSKSHYAMLLIENVHDVIVQNAVIIGDRFNHKGKKGEWGMGIYIKGGTNILINNVSVSQCWGDGIDVTHSDKQNSENVIIREINLHKNRRNGITIGSGKNITLSEIDVSFTDGTLPTAGICIEPNNSKALLENLKISNIKSSNNGVGVSVGLMRYPSYEDRELSITISNLISINDSIGIVYGDYKRNYDVDFKKLVGLIEFKDIKIINPIFMGIKLFSPYGYEFSPYVVFKSIDIHIEDLIVKKNQRKLVENNKIRNIIFSNIKFN
ncbi:MULTISPECIES: right-handed parallel beta-helix repeat-containing protein [unclassified Myroides]|uniref:right-handed parallel beta-helix repeat-containing protein n=1 Tax=unclassified Myroides TaxID=2642485 RepID=UPI003101782E